MGISRDRMHKRRKTGGRRETIRKKRKYELGRPPALTKLGPKRIHNVRVRGGTVKLRAMRIEHGNFAWATQAVSRKTRIIDVVYNASNNELVRTKTLVKNAIVMIDCAPFRQWFEGHYLKELGRKRVLPTSGKGASTAAAAAGPGASDASAPAGAAPAVEEDILTKQRSKKTLKKFETRRKLPRAELETGLKEQFSSGRLLACISSRPGQVGRADGYILEGKELEFYSKKLKAKKAK